MRGLNIALLMLLGILNGYGQNAISINYVDSMSAHFYNLKKWADLIKIGEKGVDKGFDNYYLNIRLAIAYFKKNRYYECIYFAKKAAKNKNGYPEFAKQYIYWANIFLGEKFLANEIYADLQPETKEYLKDPAYKFLESVGLTLGLATSKAYTQKMKIAGIELTQLWNRNVKAHYEWSNLNFTKEWGTVNQNSFFVGLDINLGRGISLQPGFYYSYLKGTINSYSNFRFTEKSDTVINGITYHNTVNYDETIQTSGKFSERLKVYNLGARYVLNRWRFYTNFCGIFSLQWQPLQDHTQLKWDGISITDLGTKFLLEGDTVYHYSYNKDRKFEQYVLGYGVYYHSGLMKDRIIPGFHAYITFKDEKVFMPISPNIAFKINENIWLYASYIQKGNYYLVEKNGRLISNYLNKIKHLLTVSGTYYWGKKLRLKGTVLLENRDDYYSANIQQYTNFYLSLNYKL